MSTTKQHHPAAPAALVALAAIMAIAGCTSDEPNFLGAGVPSELQVATPETEALTTSTVRGHVTLVEEDVSYDESPVLYFGNSDTESSSMLVQYDFSALPDSVPAWLTLSEDNIQYARLNLYRLKFYAPEVDPEDAAAKQTGFDKNYEIYELAAPLDTSLYPGPEPAFDALLIDEITSGANVFLNFNPATIAGWVENGNNGIIIREGPDSEVSGLIGYAALDMKSGGYQEIEREDDDTIVGPTITIAVSDSLVGGEQTEYFDEIFLIAPIADVSTLHQLEAPSPDLSVNMVMRTHARLAPYFAFDLSQVPEDVFVNRAVVRLGLDFDGSYGQIQSLALHEVPLTLVAGADSVTLADLQAQGDVVAGNFAVDVGAMAIAEEDWVGWDVTSTVQRIRNGVLDPDTIFMVTAGESFSGYITTFFYGPDFYMSRYAFRGFGDSELFPHLEVTFTPFGGGER